MKVARAVVDGADVVGVVDGDRFRALHDDAPGRVLELLLTRPSTGAAQAVPLTEVRLLCPTHAPPSFRDFMIFEEHVANARRGQPVPDAWYAAPAFYFTNPACLFGPDEDIPAPPASRRLDFELEVAAIVGADAAGLDPDDPATLELIAGFTLMNDWSARDLQLTEMPVGLGPAKGKDFATSLGPWLVTPDELSPDGKGRFAQRLDVWVDGRRLGGGNLADSYFTWGKVLARAAENTRLCRGDLIGSGTVGTGCLLELRALGDKDSYPWLRPGNVVELVGAALGRLRNRIAPVPATGDQG
ncbi:fumarylacetoacetate hydrolase family protein [Dactylosporangium sp. CA-092794]|uniref:fumarylacetoacetate hydrolase family protein n=1 Tax=Dactylosporangium sp. CA-092794 TaxID=3239929 RepID=UPI003D8C3891